MASHVPRRAIEAAGQDDLPVGAERDVWSPAVALWADPTVDPF